MHWQDCRSSYNRTGEAAAARFIYACDDGISFFKQSCFFVVSWRIESHRAQLSMPRSIPRMYAI